MDRRITALLLAASLVWLVGCTPSDRAGAPRDGGDGRATVPDALEPAPEPAADSMVGARGFGPVQAGMTLAEAEAALRTTLEPVPAGEPCAFAFVGGEHGIALMVIDGRIARIDIQHGTVRTAEGAGIGDSEERIHALYPGRVEVLPHKYIEGHYLIVTPAAPADSGHRIVFETDGRRVLRFRSGRLPEVRWVEGCS